MQFMLQSQSNADARHEKIMDEHERIMAEHRRIMAELDKMMAGMDRHDQQLRDQTLQIQALAVISRDLVDTARLHSRRLDRLENPSA